LQKARN
jgi:hypothetical protein